jgi:alkanesulfonate monooxygenase SsuD/methylene tetrahydromethanopterin reductase-like flavin-dependent oxidoreductase (luciferase family)
VGWCKEEVIACGYDWSTRGRRCDEFLEVFQRLWTQDEVSFDGEFVSIDKVRLDPKPVQVPHLPIIVGGYADAAYRRAARFGAGWYGFNTDPENSLKAMNKLDGFLKESGRERGDDFEIIITPPYQVNAEMVEQYAQIGVDRIVVQLGGQRPDQVDKRFAMLEKLVKEVA